MRLERSLDLLSTGRVDGAPVVVMASSVGLHFRDGRQRRGGVFWTRLLAREAARRSQQVR